MQDAFEIVVETITPQRARLMLAESASFNNRPVKRSVVARYASDMATGAWALSGDSIKLDVDGRVIDGQHRPLACVEANSTFETAIAYGLATEVAQIVDQNTPRSACDRLRMADADVAHPKYLAAAARYFYGLEDGGSFTVAISFSQLATVIDEHPTIAEGVQALASEAEVKMLYRGLALPAALHAFLVERSDRRNVDSFFALVAGVGVDPESPVKALRARLAASRDRRLGGHGQTLRDRAAATLLAWNHWHAGNSRHHIRWNGKIWPVAVCTDTAAQRGRHVGG